MRTADIRAAYLRFFEERQHKVVASSSLVPANDPTLLFTNSGMVQFKDALLGREQRPYSRATSAQRCVRAGGKHNDLENVGYTARHHTFFEMLGNFSFGDYFKSDTITWAWTFVTDVLKLPKDRIWVTVHPTDDESRRLWTDVVGLPAERVVDIEDNFWAMGDTGPCGPCTELFYDHGPEVAGGPPGSPDEDGDRYVEFWNLVFPQFERSADGTLEPLPQPGVDTGMGLERVAAIMQGVHSCYEIDLFERLMHAAGRFAGITDPEAVRASPSLRVIADHIRSTAFLIADGVVPGNEDRSYVLRRIIRRALRHGYKLDIREPFFHKLAHELVTEMGEAYPVLRDQFDLIVSTLRSEEERFAETLGQGMALLNRAIERVKDGVIPGDVVFQLYDTYGFPADLTADVARERDLAVDMAGFDAAMAAQRKRGREAQKFSAALGQRVRADGRVDFIGHGETEGEGRVVNLFRLDGDDVVAVEALNSGDNGIVVLDRTPFYAESGGQVGDAGSLATGSAQFEVGDTQPSGDQHLHVGHLGRGILRVGEMVTATVDADRRQRTRLNHSATHLLHAALRQVLGDHVQQRGSLVDPDRLRFDFSHTGPVTSGQLRVVEDLVNQQIRDNSDVDTQIASMEEALELGAMALFGEKYGDRVRVLTMGNGFSVELCGGTHVTRTGDIGVMRIVSEGGIAAGIRRIEAVTGKAALDWLDKANTTVDELAGELRVPRDEVADKVRQLAEQNRRLQKQALALEQKRVAAQGGDLAARARDVAGVKVLAVEVEGEPGSLPATLDVLRGELGDSVIVLACVDQGKVTLAAGVSKPLIDRIKAPEVVGWVGGQIGAKGGGRPDLARAGGGSPQHLAAALEKLPEWLAATLDG